MNPKKSIRTIGQRTTRQRKAVYEALSQLDKPVTVSDILRFIESKQKSIDTASVYRILAALRAAGLVKEVEFGEGKKRFELISEDNHHHHLVCEKCGTVEDICLDEKMIFRHVRTDTGFQITRHALEFFGLCRLCKDQD